MEANGISTPPFLPDEIILEILSKVSLKNLYRLKWVSKSWFSLITNEVLNQLVNPQDLSFYYSTFYRIYILENKSSMSLDFLPKENNNQLPKLTILDCCGGLVFCSLCYSENGWPKTSYYVCNPVDKSYNQILSVGFRPYFFMLDFNPLISPHYKLIVVRKALEFALEFAIYNSENRCFEEKVRVPIPLLFDMTSKRSYIAFWNGNVYLHCRFIVNTGTENRIIMINGVLGGSEKDIVHKFINFPKGSEVYKWDYMATWRDRLRFVSIDDHKIRVWALQDNQEDEWTLEHDCPCSLASVKHCSKEKEKQKQKRLYVVGLHPLQNAVLIIFNNLLFAYDLDQMLFEKICEVKDGVEHSFSGLDELVFPFSPCFAKEVLV